MDSKAKLKPTPRPAPDWPALFIIAAAAAARLFRLSIKPPHFDEGVNGWFIDQMAHTGYYHYDPTNYHGPLHFYILFLAQTLLGRHIWALRLPLCLAGIAAVWFTLKFDRFIGRGASRWAAAAMAISPGCVFYSRYAIHETWMMLALMLCAWGLAGLWHFGERKYLWALASGIAVAILMKETYFIHFGCAVLALPCVWVLGRISPAPEEPAAVRQWTMRDAALAAACAVGAILFFYSGALMDLPGLKGLYQCFSAWAATGKTGNGHEKDWYYWFELMRDYEWPACAGLLAALLCWLPGTPRFVRALAFYGGGALAAYSIIRYKTPWCIVSLVWPFLLLFGWGVDALRRRFPGALAFLAGTVAALVLAANTWWMALLNFQHYTDPGEKYVYVQTFTEVNRLMDPLRRLVARDHANYQISGHIMLSSYHPLPWMLGDFPNIGYYGGDLTPQPMDADFLLVEDSRIDEAERALKDSYFTAPLHLREAEDTSRLYLNAKTFGPLFPGRQPEFVPEQPVPPPQLPARLPVR